MNYLLSILTIIEINEMLTFTQTLNLKMFVSPLKELFEENENSVMVERMVVCNLVNEH